MPRRHTLAPVLAAAVLLVASAAFAAPFRVLVGNDDGVEAEGIAALVHALTRNSSLEVSVYAPLTNQSGTGDRVTTGPLTVVSAATADGYPATAVEGFPADGVLFGVLQGLPARPDLVVTGINEGQNVADLVNVSGTVGAALTAARMGIPAFAVSQAGGDGIDYQAAADYTASLVARYRLNATFRRLLRISAQRARVLNVNFPTCTTGELRGVRSVALGRVQRVVGYDQQDGSDVWDPIVVRTPIGSNDCTSSLRQPKTDLEALNNGFASVTPLDPDLTSDDLVTPLARFVDR
jgi:5'-nucleotidase